MASFRELCCQLYKEIWLLSENCAVNWLVYASSVNMTDIVEYKTRGACEGQEEGEEGARDMHRLPSNILKVNILHELLRFPSI